MASTIPVGEWLDVIEREYLATYVPEGGSSIKFAVASDSVRERLVRETRSRCSELNYMYLQLDGADTRLDMPNQVFLDLSAQLDWPSLARRLVLRVAGEAGYRVSGIDPDGEPRVYDAIAKLNGVEADAVRGELRPAIQGRVSKNRLMLRDFRAAMSHLCVQDAMNNSHPLVGWLGGVRVSTVRDFSIYTRIDRTTARYFIESTLIWIQEVGYSGTVLALDNARVTVYPNPKDGKHFYTRMRAMDHFEMLREFIDGVDRLVGTFMLVATNEELVAEHGPRSRGYGIYDALKTRVMPDVRDKHLANPVASLVHLEQ